jgi:hypothetical protein
VLFIQKMQIQKANSKGSSQCRKWHILDFRSEGSSCVVKSLLSYPGPFFKRYPRKDAYLLITFMAKVNTVFSKKVIIFKNNNIMT